MISMASMLMSKEELEKMELTQKQFTSSIERAQKQIEAWHFGIRKHLFDYDSVILHIRLVQWGQFGRNNINRLWRMRLEQILYFLQWEDPAEKRRLRTAVRLIRQ